MRVVFISNYFNHHQKAFSDEMNKLTGGEYFFIETIPMEDERVNMGWNMINTPNYVLKNYNDVPENEYIRGLINEADVVIIGSASNKIISERLKRGKLVFRYSERIFKKGFAWYKWPIWMIRFFYQHNRHKNLYMLCASAYTALDYAKTFSFINKTYKWGYFPEVKKYEDVDQLIESKKENSLLWVARFIDWKHPEIPIQIVKRLQDDGYNVHLSMIGNGVLENDLRENIKKIGAEKYIDLLGAMSPEEVRKYMEQAQIFLFTSDRNEGWGAVLNEAMNSACAVVASHAIGSAPFLISDKENGCIYKDGDWDDLYKKVKWLLDNPKQRVALGKKAYQTMVQQWNAEIAARRFIEISKMLLSGQDKVDLYDDGVCSRANILKDNWYKP